VLGDQRQQRAESGGAGIDAGTRYNPAALIDERDIMMRLGPIDPARQFHFHKFSVPVSVFSFVLELEAGAAT